MNQMPKSVKAIKISCYSSESKAASLALLLVEISSLVLCVGKLATAEYCQFLLFEDGLRSHCIWAVCREAAVFLSRNFHFLNVHAITKVLRQCNTVTTVSSRQCSLVAVVSSRQRNLVNVISSR